MLKAAFFGLGTLVAGGLTLATWGSLTACQNLDVTSPLFDPDAASDYDAGFVPEAPDDDGDDGSSGAPPAGPTPTTVRVRLANLTQGGESLQLCATQAPASGTAPPFAVAQDVVSGFRIDAVATGSLSAPASIGSIADKATGRFNFRVGPDCATQAGTLAQLTATLSLRGGAAVTLIIAGNPAAEDPTDPLVPRVTSVNDVLAPAATSTSLRAFHGAVGLAPFDVAIDGTTVLEGVRFNTGIGRPYASTNGYAPVAAGIPQGATLRLSSGTTSRSFSVPDRIRRGIAQTLLVTGSSVNNVSAQLCSDRAPESGSTSECVSLPAQN